MPTPRGEGLAGSADGSIPGWQDRVKATNYADQTEKQKRKRKNRPGQVLIECELPFLTMLRAAATSRGMSSVGYARRAIAAFISHDLGIEFTEVTRNFPAPFRHGEALDPNNPNGVHMKRGLTVDDGQGYGDWKVK